MQLSYGAHGDPYPRQVVRDVRLALGIHLKPMVDALLSGRVTSFRREQGFGVITLDDGRDIKFDASACTMVPDEGAPVRLRVGPAKWGGGFKALHVEPRGSSALFVPATPLHQQLASLARNAKLGDPEDS